MSKLLVWPVVLKALLSFFLAQAWAWLRARIVRQRPAAVVVLVVFVRHSDER